MQGKIPTQISEKKEEENDDGGEMYCHVEMGAGM